MSEKLALMRADILPDEGEMDTVVWIDTDVHICDWRKIVEDKHSIEIGPTRRKVSRRLRNAISGRVIAVRWAECRKYLRDGFVALGQGR